MSEAQRVIKYLALAFAYFLIGVIICSFLGFLGFLGFLNTEPAKENSVFVYNESEILNIRNIDIDLDVSKLTIVPSDKLDVRTNNKYLKSYIEGNTLVVKDKKHFTFFKNYSVEISLPSDLVINTFKLDTGVGDVKINNITADNLELDCGVGNTKLDNFNIIRETEIDGGVGNVDITNSTFNNLDLDSGVGDFSFTGIITGRSSVDSGVGNVKLNLSDSLDNYTFNISKGIGSFTIDDKKVHDGDVYGKGPAYIKVSGGVGDLSIKGSTIANLEEENNGDITAMIIEDSISSSSARVTLLNNASEDYTYLGEYSIEVLENNKWKKVGNNDFKKDINVIIPSYNSVTLDFNWEEDLGLLNNGNYRIIIKLKDINNDDILITTLGFKVTYKQY